MQPPTIIYKCGNLVKSQQSKEISYFYSFKKILLKSPSRSFIPSVFALFQTQVLACFLVISCHGLSHHYKLSIEALKGDENAQILLGHIRLYVDPQESLMWFTKAARQGNAMACKQLGRAFALGSGTPRNQSRAIHWYLCAAKAGNTNSLFSLYLLHKENGFLVQAGASLSLAVRQSKNPEWQEILEKMKLNFSPLEIKSLEKEISDLNKRIEDLPNFTKENPPLEYARFQQLTFQNGDVYTGETKNGRAHGYGRKTSQCGESYFGFFENGLQEGYGLAFNSKGIVTFEGIWERGKPLSEQPNSQTKRK